jgi:two-component system, cell cycle response regulator
LEASGAGGAMDADHAAASRKRARRVSDSSTDSIELSDLRESGSGRTHSFLPTISQAPPGLAAASEIEANVILIAHPENRMLGTRFRLRPGSVVEIGRSPAAEISLPEVLSVSRTHARIEHRGLHVVVEDLGSTNGTYVNDRLAQGETVLSSGDRFQVGAVHFKFLHERDVENAYHLAIYNLVTRDGLTEIFNQRKYSEEADRETARALRYGRPLTLLLFDLDHFKAINDSYGHLCGDFVLKAMTQRVQSVLRAEQIFARVGGEEFVILCPETDGHHGALLAEKLRERIGSDTVEYAGFQVPVTCSFGIAQLRPEMPDSESLYAAADRALYHSKQSGRNRVTLYRGELHGRPATG